MLFHVILFDVSGECESRRSDPQTAQTQRPSALPNNTVSGTFVCHMFCVCCVYHVSIVYLLTCMLLCVNVCVLSHRCIVVTRV